MAKNYRAKKTYVVVSPTSERQKYLFSVFISERYLTGKKNQLLTLSGKRLVAIVTIRPNKIKMPKPHK